MKGKYEFSATEQNRVQLIRLFAGHNCLSFSSMFGLMAESEEFRIFFDSIFHAAPFQALFWECPPLTNVTTSQDAEFVLVDAPGLSRLKVDWKPFSRYLLPGIGKESVIDFDNLGRDARLIVPYPLTAASDYTHLLAFVENAPSAQKRRFWKRVGELVLRLIGERAIWVSTAGMGVSWLHVRVCSTPKYYQYLPYETVRSEPEL